MRNTAYPALFMNSINPVQGVNPQWRAELPRRRTGAGFLKFAPFMNLAAYCMGILFVLLLSGCGSKDGTSSSAAPLAVAPLSSMVGKHIKSDEIKGWLALAGEPSDIKKSDGSVEYLFKEKGLSLHFDPGETLTAVILYSAGADNNEQYQGQLPYGLSFDLRRGKIEKILGAPEISGGPGLINYLGVYPSKGISIRYDRTDMDEQNARIYTIAINRALGPT
jgi:hypothetical protein